jgi:pimeloyl-ACP methyl ester carboxylesterase
MLPGMDLEVIDKGHVTPPHPNPLLFVHGAWHAAWCWDEYFLDYFAERGYRATALSIRGHGASRTAKSLRTCSLVDYVADIRSVAETLGAEPVLVGHSMGGLLTQKYLESRAAPAGVLLASVPPQGIARFLGRMTRKHPWLMAKSMATGKSLRFFGTAQLAREHLFSAATAESDVRRHMARLNEESQRMTVDALVLRLPKVNRVTTPLLVLGADDDAMITRDEVHATARAYGTEAEFFAGMGHDMMLEPDWKAVAERIDTWLGQRRL